MLQVRYIRSRLVAYAGLGSTCVVPDTAPVNVSTMKRLDVGADRSRRGKLPAVPNGDVASSEHSAKHITRSPAVEGIPRIHITGPGGSWTEHAAYVRVRASDCAKE
jgi:hypothetical protein